MFMVDVVNDNFDESVGSKLRGLRRVPNVVNLLDGQRRVDAVRSNWKVQSQV